MATEISMNQATSELLDALIGLVNSHKQQFKLSDEYYLAALRVAASSCGWPAVTRMRHCWVWV